MGSVGFGDSSIRNRVYRKKRGEEERTFFTVSQICYWAAKLC